LSNGGDGVFLDLNVLGQLDGNSGLIVLETDILDPSNLNPCNIHTGFSSKTASVGEDG
jgi:hypothetical protein